jgi:hypothetical protein
MSPLKTEMIGWRSRHPSEERGERVKAPGKEGEKEEDVRPADVELM